MPTAVEHVLRDLLTLDFTSSLEQRGLTGAFADTDVEMQGLLNTDLSQRSFLKLERQASSDIDRIGNSYLNAGEDFRGLAGFALGLDTVLVDLTATPTVTAAVVVAGSPQADFLTLDAGLRATGSGLTAFGADFRALDRAANVTDFTADWHKIAADATSLQTTMGNEQTAFAALSADFLALGGVNANGAPANALDYNLGAALKTVAADFGTLSQDFLGIDNAFGDGGGANRPVTTESLALLPSAGGALSTTNGDFATLSHDLAGLAAPVAAGVEAVVAKAFGGGGGTAFP